MFVTCPNFDTGKRKDGMMTLGIVVLKYSTFFHLVLSHIRTSGTIVQKNKKKKNIRYRRYYIKKTEEVTNRFTSK